MEKLDSRQIRARGQHDSLYGRAGVSIRHDEIIVCNEAQCTTRYIVEIGAYMG
jgi:hypothetical protein